MTVSQLIDALTKLRDQGHGELQVVTSKIKWGEPSDEDVTDVYKDKHDYGHEVVRLETD